jgi:SAM-dependent methyltransferase
MVERSSKKAPGQPPLNVFISWSGERSQLVAAALYEWLKDLFQNSPLSLFLSNKDIRGGTDWHPELIERLLESRFGILCLTPENRDSPWLAFEAGALVALHRKGLVYPYLFSMSNKQVASPLSHKQSRVADEEGTRELVLDINAALGEQGFPLDLLNNHITQLWPQLHDKLSKIPADAANMPWRIALSLLKQELPSLIEQFGQRPAFKSNDYFAQVTLDALGWIMSSLSTDPSSPYIDIPLTLYPSHLVNLLKRQKPVVKAVAIVDVVERFWPQPPGEDIRIHTTRDSTRIFVFHNPEGLRQHIGMLLKHARQYNTYALSHERLVSEYRPYAQDFSLIGSTKPLLGYYHESAKHERDVLPVKVIRFSTQEEEVSNHLDAFEKILALAQPVNPLWASGHELDEGAADAFVNEVFTPEVRHYAREPVEMSAYISLKDYHKHEEEHAYYLEMVREMIQLVSRHAQPNLPMRVLEFGAGTGLFTKRLAELPNVDLVAVELDWACFKWLEQTIAELESPGNSLKITSENKDSRSYNPPGRFRVITSAFADHHIHPVDKLRYFKNVRNNLEDGGIFVVGDEFLHEHDSKDDPARREALERWHGHIIDIAKSKGQDVLAKLEHDALQSGLQERGDFKVSCSEYEKHLERANLKIKQRIKIGPLDRDDIGGIYVYVIEKA